MRKKSVMQTWFQKILKRASVFKESRCMWWLRKKRPCAQKMSGSKEPTITSLRVTVSKDRSHRRRWWKIFESTPRKAVSFVVERERRCRNGMSRSCRRCFRVTAEEGCQGGREEEEEDENSRKREK